VLLSAAPRREIVLWSFVLRPLLLGGGGVMGRAAPLFGAASGGLAALFSVVAFLGYVVLDD